jgi:outer membrane lipopolysaccharide assembly protein LptE/RlpB
MIHHKTAPSSKELHQILALQKANLPISIFSEEKEQEGFLTVHQEDEILKRMNDVYPQIIAVDKNVLAGYTLCINTKLGGEIEY